MLATLYTEPQFYSESNPCTALWAAVLVTAIHDLDDKVEWARTRNWLYDDSEEIGSFAWICDVLDLDANKIQIACLSREGRKELLQRHSWQRWLKD